MRRTKAQLHSLCSTRDAQWKLLGVTTTGLDGGCEKVGRRKAVSHSLTQSNISYTAFLQVSY